MKTQTQVTETKSIIHFDFLKNYVFAQKIPTKKGGYYFQLYKLVENEIIEIGGLKSQGFKLNFIDGKKSNQVATIITLYKAIRNEHEEFKAFKTIQ